MKKSRRLQPVQSLAEQRKKQAELQLGQAQQQLQAEQQKLLQLQNYLQEYQHDLLQTGQAGVTIEKLQRLQSFKQRLVDALEQQHQQIAFCEQTLTYTKQAWQLARGRERAMESLIQRSRQQEQQQEDKSLQRQMDELALLRLRRD
ncbi:MAG: flagellar FliJ protein [Motiliproteus sp.]|jgi:flagellar FliJ protein